MFNMATVKISYTRINYSYCKIANIKLQITQGIHLNRYNIKIRLYALEGDARHA